MPSQRQKTRWPGGWPLTARSGTEAAAISMVLFVVIFHAQGAGRSFQVPCGTGTSYREWAMNEGPFTAATVRRGEWLSSRLSSDRRERAAKKLLQDLLAARSLPLSRRKRRTGF